MEQPPTIKPLIKSNPINFEAFDENSNQFIIKLYIENDYLVFEALSYDDIDFYDKEYKSINSYKSLAQSQKIFSSYDSLEEIKEFLESLINKVNSNLKYKFKKKLINLFNYPSLTWKNKWIDF